MTAATSSRQYHYSVGKRKTAIATLRMYTNGTGDVVVNKMKAKEYFATALQVENALAPLKLTDNLKNFDLEVRVQGGGKAAQSDAMRHAVSRALLLVDPDNRATLKPEGFLRRDARIKERKKPGLKRARRAPQFSKR